MKKTVVKSSFEKKKNDIIRGVNVLSLRIVTLHAKLEDHLEFIHGTRCAGAHGHTARKNSRGASECRLSLLRRSPRHHEHKPMTSINNQHHLRSETELIVLNEIEEFRGRRQCPWLGTRRRTNQRGNGGAPALAKALRPANHAGALGAVPQPPDRSPPPKQQ